MVFLLHSTIGYASNVHRHIKRIHMKISRIIKGKIVIQSDDDCTATHVDEMIKCAECKEMCPNKIALYEHSKLHVTDCKETVDGYNLDCDECNTHLNSYDEFVDHMCDIHNVSERKSVKPIKCRWCGKRFIQMSGLYTHIRYMHQMDTDSSGVSVAIRTGPVSEQTSCLCTICGKFLTTSVALQRHLLIHTNSRPFQCDVCPASFRFEELLHIPYLRTGR